jgi:hypothetical protein
MTDPTHRHSFDTSSDDGMTSGPIAPEENALPINDATGQIIDPERPTGNDPIITQDQADAVHKSLHGDDAAPLDNATESSPVHSQFDYGSDADRIDASGSVQGANAQGVAHPYHDPNQPVADANADGTIDTTDTYDADADADAADAADDSDVAEEVDPTDV